MPSSLQQQALIRRTLEPLLGGSIRAMTHLQGSFAGDLYRVECAEGRFALKWADRSLPGILRAEADGLRLLAETDTIRIPQVRAVHDRSLETSDDPAFLLIEWLQGGSVVDMTAFGAQTALLHRNTIGQSQGMYGLAYHNYLGNNMQYNTPHAEWPTFFREQRLLPQVELAERNGYMPTARRRGLERLMDRLDDLLSDVPRVPVLIHGDLWGGNVLAVDNRGTPALIDPAVYYADREAELAYTELFSGFDAQFYAAYNDVWPLEPGYAERRDLYNVYHLLNHLNIFGTSYAGHVDAVIRRYA